MFQSIPEKSYETVFQSMLLKSYETVFQSTSYETVVQSTGAAGAGAAETYERIADAMRALKIMVKIE